MPCSYRWKISLSIGPRALSGKKFGWRWISTRQGNLFSTLECRPYRPFRVPDSKGHPWNGGGPSRATSHIFLCRRQIRIIFALDDRGSVYIRFHEWILQAASLRTNKESSSSGSEENNATIFSISSLLLGGLYFMRWSGADSIDTINPAGQLSCWP